MTVRLAGLLVWGLLAGVMAAQAGGAHRLDDSATSVEQAPPRMEWLPPRPGTPADMLTTQLVVNVRIDTRQWVGRQARVYMVLPPDESPPLALSWTSNGRLLPGQLASGERALVYVGPIDAPLLQDRLTIQVMARANWLGSSRRLTVHFECEPN